MAMQHTLQSASNEDDYLVQKFFTGQFDDSSNSVQVKRIDGTTEKQSSMISIDRFPNFTAHTAKNQTQIYAAAMTRNCEYLLLMNEASQFTIIDMITNDFQLTFARKQNLSQPLTACCFTYFTDYIICGSATGSLLISNFYQLPSGTLIKNKRVLKSYIQGSINQIFHLKNDLLITVSNTGVKFVKLDKLITFLDKGITKSFSQTIFTVDSTFPGEYKGFSSGISCSALQQNNLAIAQGNGTISIFNLCNQIVTINLLFVEKGILSKATAQFKPRTIENRFLITSLAFSEGERLLAVAYGFVGELGEKEKEEFSVQSHVQMDFIDLKRKKAIVTKLTENIRMIQALRFSPNQNQIIIGYEDGIIEIYSYEQKKLMPFIPETPFHEGGVREILIINDDHYWPQVLTIGLEGKIIIHIFDAPKLHCLDLIPFVFWVEQRLQNSINYTPATSEIWGQLQLLIAGVDKRSNQMQKSCFQGDEYFKPLFKKILEYTEYSVLFSQQYKKYLLHKKKLYFLPQAIVFGALAQLTGKKISNALNNVNSALGGRQQIHMHSQLQSALGKKQSAMRTAKAKNIMKMYMGDEEESNEATQLELKEFIENTFFEEQVYLQDDRFLIADKLLQRMTFQNLTNLILAKCPMLFDIRLPIFKKYISPITIFIRLLGTLPSIIDRVQYADFSYNHLDLQTCTTLLSIFPRTLQYLDFSFNQIGSNSFKSKITRKQTQVQKKQQQNQDIQKIRLLDELGEVRESIFTTQIRSLLKQSYVISLRSNEFTDEDGQELIELLIGQSIRVIDLSGNRQFGQKTIDALQLLSQNLKLQRFIQPPEQSVIEQLPVIEEEDQFESQAKEGGISLKYSNQKRQRGKLSNKHDLKSNKDQKSRRSSISNRDSTILQRPNLQLVILEFNPDLCEASMKQIAALIIHYMIEQMTQKQSIELAVSTQLPFMIYVVNNKTKNIWDQSLLALYENNDKQEDPIKNCFILVLLAAFNMFFKCWCVVRDQTFNCLKQCFCSLFFIKKYLLCFYCVCLQSQYGKCITGLLGIKTADYEYNAKKDTLKQSLEKYRFGLNTLFWINFLLFYVIVIYIPIQFVISCGGHKWTGHFIYIGYAIFVASIETVLALYCIKFDITHFEYVHGPMPRRMAFFVLLFFFHYPIKCKDLLLSQLSKFDVYSDMCFITTVMTCGSTIEIGYLAIIVMAINLSMTFFNVSKLLLNKFGGDENYIDYLCNYCSLLEINVVAVLLEKWTIQNTIDFMCFKSLPNRVYTAVSHTFAEDLPQFMLQLAYIFLNPQQKGIEILLLSLISSTFSIIVSVTKSISITKANRINDAIMMNEVKTKLEKANLERNQNVPKKQVNDPEFNVQLQTFLHDYYDKYDGHEEIADIEYGLNDYILRDAKDNKKAEEQNLNLLLGLGQILAPAQKNTKSAFRQQAGTSNKKQAIKGITQLEDKQSEGKFTIQIHKHNSLQVQQQDDDFFEVYDYFINSNQARLVKKLWQDKIITEQVIAETLLQIKIVDFVGSRGLKQNTFEANSVYEAECGAFIDSITHQALILNTVFNFLKEQQKNIKILVNIITSPISKQDLGCGNGYTSACLLQMSEQLRKAGSLQVINKNKSNSHLTCIDHIPEIIEQIKSAMCIFYRPFIKQNTIEFVQHDCRQSFNEEIGEFDLINVGFSVRDQDKQRFLNLLSPGGVICMPVQEYPSNHKFCVFEKQIKNNLVEINTIESTYMQQKAGILTSPELQHPDKYSYSNFKKGEECILCGEDIKDDDQFYCPWTDEYICIPCADQDDDKIRIEQFVYPNNLIYIPNDAGERELSKIDSHKLGKNLQPSKAIDGNRRHCIECAPCEREQGDELNKEEGPRYICLNCKPGTLEGEMQLDICNECAEAIIQKTYEADDKLGYLQEYGHESNHLLLKVHFNSGYFSY